VKQDKQKRKEKLAKKRNTRSKEKHLQKVKKTQDYYNSRLYVELAKHRILLDRFTAQEEIIKKMISVAEESLSKITDESDREQKSKIVDGYKQEMVRNHDKIVTLNNRYNVLTRNIEDRGMTLDGIDKYVNALLARERQRELQSNPQKAEEVEKDSEVVGDE